MNKTSAAPHPVLGVLGGIGPMSTVYFYEMITAHTKAEKDQDHLDIVISSRATTPDRSAYILGESNDDPFSVMERDAEMLVRYGATVLAIPCNTAHYFYDRLQRSLPVPVLNMIQLTVRTAKAGGCQKLGILATSGTVASCSYQRMCAAEGIGCAVPSEADHHHLRPDQERQAGGFGAVRPHRRRPQGPRLPEGGAGLHRAQPHQAGLRPGRLLHRQHRGTGQSHHRGLRQDPCGL